jgi:hypothetical protein
MRVVVDAARTVRGNQSECLAAQACIVQGAGNAGVGSGGRIGCHVS